MNTNYNGYEIKEQQQKHNFHKKIYVVYTITGSCLFIGKCIESAKRYIDNLIENKQNEQKLKTAQVKSYVSTRIQMLRDAVSDLRFITLKSDCLTCRYNRSQEELSEMNDEDYLQAFDKCRTCKNYYPNNFEEK